MLKKRRTIPVLLALGLSLGAAFALLPRGSALNAEGATAGEPQAAAGVDGLLIDRVKVDLSKPPGLMGQWQSALVSVRSGARLLLENTDMVIIDTDGAPAELSLRAYIEGTWGPWYEIAADSEEGPDGLPGTEGSSRLASAIGPVWIGSDTTAVEIVLQEGSVTQLTVDKLTIDDSFAEADSLAAIEVSSNSTVKPAIKSRADWGAQGWAEQNGDCAGGPFLADNLRAVVVHHTVTTNDYTPEEVPGILRGIYHHHVNINGWCDVAYNFLIDRFGTIWQGRTGAPEDPIIGGHAKGFNSRTAGVALLGQYQGNISRPGPAYPSAQAMASLEALATWKLGLHAVDPLGKTWLKNRANTVNMKYEANQWVNLPTVFGHRDVGLTSCPGNRAYVNLAPMAARIAAARDGVVSPATFALWHGADLGVAVFTIDAKGGIRPALDGAAPPAWQDIGSATALAIDGTETAGYVLTTDGRLHRYGDAPAVSDRPGGTSVVDLQVRASGKSGYVVTADGKFHGFGGVIDRQASGGGVAGVIDNDARGYMVSATGTLSPLPGSPARELKMDPVGKIIDLTLWSDGQSGWALDSSGNIIGFGLARTHMANMGGTPVAIVGSPTETGGWVLDSEGQLWTFGDERLAAPVASHVGVKNSVGGAAVAWLRNDDAYKKTDDGKWLMAMFGRVGGREPTTTELEAWKWRIDERGTGLLTDGLVHSDYWAGQVIDDIYQTALGRRADAKGKAYWLAQLRSGMSNQDLGIFFYGSKEYVARSGGNLGFVRELYENLLKRSPDPNGLKYWSGLLDSEQASPADVAAGFYQSLESRRERVERLYLRLVGRPPAADDREEWAELLASTDDFDFTAQLISGPDFYRSAQ